MAAGVHYVFPGIPYSVFRCSLVPVAHQLKKKIQGRLKDVWFTFGIWRTSLKTIEGRTAFETFLLEANFTTGWVCFHWSSLGRGEGEDLILYPCGMARV